MLMLSAMDAHHLRSRWVEMDRPALVTSPLLSSEDAGRMRAFFEAESPAACDRARGSFAELCEHEFPAIVRRCRSIAESITASALSVESVCLRRFGAGDFQKSIGVEPQRKATVELTLDFSESPLGTGRIIYLTDGLPSFEVSQRPGSISLAEMGDATTRRVDTLEGVTEGAAVFRLIMTLGVRAN